MTPAPSGPCLYQTTVPGRVREHRPLLSLTRPALSSSPVLGLCFTHHFRARMSHRPALEDDAKRASSVFLGDPGAGGGHLLAQLLQAQGNTTVFSDPRSELTCNNDNHGISGFVPRKRARVGDAGACGLIMDGHGGALVPTVPMQQAFAASCDVLQSRARGSGAASTSGRPASAAPVPSQGLLSQLHRQGLEIDAIVRIEPTSQAFAEITR
ncbi:hypothetical protein EJB05_21498 [Eragrostis curvula]|uniref:Uncharacterized protein n=1 Tax=Eragrostis curvula TaxID=38414 RepID=A0A5J9V3E3_9POAL|nr:hypothetical protein EJB05_21498 [Eragrostis curvula]